MLDLAFGVTVLQDSKRCQMGSIEYSMSLDLSDLIEERFPSEPQPQTSAPARGSLAVPIDKKADERDRKEGDL